MLDRTAATRLADTWWARVCDTTPVPLPPRIRDFLAGLVADLAEVLHSEPFTTDAAVRAGEALVYLELTDPVVLTRSAAVLADLPAHAGSPVERARYQHRFPLVIGALGQGFAQALQQRTLAGQQGIHRSLAAERQAAAEAAQLSESRFRTLFDNTAAAVFVSDLSGRFTETNSAMAALLGRTVEQLRGTSAFDFMHPDDRSEAARQIYRRLIVPGSGRMRLEMRFRRGDATYAWVSGSLALVPGSDGQEGHLIGFGDDVTEQRRLRDELYWQARHDTLTKLPNRLYLREVLDAAIKASGPTGRIGMCFLDLDGFKAVNDRYGHGVGDRLLAAIACRLRDAAADKVDLVARLGGDEFVALIAPPIVEDRVVAVSRALLAAVQRPIEIDGRTLAVSASIGALSSRIGEMNAEALLDSADAGLYRAKADTNERIALELYPSQEFPALTRH